MPETNYVHVYHRMEFLRKWKAKEGVNATYQNLLTALLNIGDAQTAHFVVTLWSSNQAAGTIAIGVIS